MRLKLEADALAAYEAVTDADLLDGIEAVFDGLEKDPGQAWLREQRWADPPMWGVEVRGGGDDILILWAVETYAGQQVAVIRYLGTPATGGG